jgi:NUMOD1 domain
MLQSFRVETLKNILNRKPHEAKTIEAYNLISKQIFTFSSVNKASKNLGIHHDFINKHLSRNTIYFGEDGRQFKFKYTFNPPCLPFRPPSPKGRGGL